MIRSATIHDRRDFCRLWMELMKSQREHGARTLANHHNLRLYLGFFESYVFGSLYGMVLFWQPTDAPSPLGVVMAGESLDQSDWETDMGRTATLWGVWVEPEHRGKGIGLKLFHRAREIALELGLETVETLVQVGNPHGEEIALAFGTHVHAHQHLVRLKEVPDGGS